MTEAQVEEMFRRMCVHCVSQPFELSQVLTDALDESVITPSAAAGHLRVYDSAGQLALMQEIRDAVQEDSESLQRTLQLDALVAKEGRGPLYFDLIVMIYKKWSKEYRAHLESVGSSVTSDDSGEYMEEGSDDDLADMLPATRKTGVVQVSEEPPPRPGMGALLAGLRNVYR
jgi:hypothetical protein